MPQSRLTSGKKRFLLSACILLLLAAGVFLLRGRQYHLLSLIGVVLACLPFLLRFEQKRPKARELVVIAAMSAISVSGRVLFAFVPGFKPVTALTIITGSALGPEAGFLSGALTAFVSNLFFGQGPWTPFQMLIWGLIGFLSGLLPQLLEKRWFLLLYGVLSGLLFSLGMDVWTVLAIDNSFSWSRYSAVLLTSLPFAAIYAASNVVFLLLLYRPIKRKLDRLKEKYGSRPL